MKSILLYILFFPLIAISQSDKKIIVQPLFGLSISTVYGSGVDSLNQYYNTINNNYNDIDGVTSSFSIKPKFDITFGINFDYILRKKILFKTGVFYVKKGFITNEKIKINIGLDSENKESKNINLNYFEVPLGLNYNLNKYIEVDAAIVLSVEQSNNVIIKTEREYQTYSSDNININTVREKSISEKDYKEVFNTNPSTIFTGFKIGISYCINKIVLNVNINRSGNFGAIFDKSNNHFLTSNMLLGYRL